MQLASMTGATPQYDPRGNMTRNDGFSFGYSSDNLMTGIGSPGGTLWPIPYDPLGRLVGDGNTTFLSDPVSGNAYVSEDWSTGFIRYIPGPGVDEPMMYLRHNGVRKHFFADERGSVIAVDEGAGVVTPQTYDEYGKPGTRWFRFGYTGQAFLTSDLYHFKARMLWAGGGRFLQTAAREAAQHRVRLPVRARRRRCDRRLQPLERSTAPPLRVTPQPA